MTEKEEEEVEHTHLLRSYILIGSLRGWAKIETIKYSCFLIHDIFLCVYGNNLKNKYII